VRSFTSFNQYSHNLLQTIENQTRSFSEYKELIPIKEETRKQLHSVKGRLTICTLDCKVFTFNMNLSDFFLLHIVIILKSV